MNYENQIFSKLNQFLNSGWTPPHCMDEKENQMINEYAQENSLWVARLIGAVAGAVISTVYLLPKSKREAASRFITAVCSGLVFGGASGIGLADWFNLADKIGSLEISLMGAAAASLCAWWVLGFLTRIAERYTNEK